MFAGTPKPGTTYATPSAAEAAFGRLSQYFAWREVWPRDGAGVPHDDAERMVVFARTALDPLRADYGAPIAVTSGIRSADRNEEVGGSPSSAHLEGEAVDVVVYPGVESRDDRAHRVASILAARSVPWDQIISYDDTTHTHIGYRRPGSGEQRGQVLVAYRDASGSRRYRPAVRPGAFV